MTNSDVKGTLDSDVEAILRDGMTLTQIAIAFKMDRQTVKAKLSGTGVSPNGSRHGAPVYALPDVAPYLAKPAYDMDEFIEKMTVADLPTFLRKEFWAGRRSQQLYEKEAAELWPTSKVVDMVSSLFKTLRMALLVTREAVERETELTDRQREIITKSMDTALEECYAATVKEFSTNENGDSEFDVPEETL